MQEMKKYDVNIDYCPTCKGVWLDRGEIDSIAKAQIRYEEEQYQKYHSENVKEDYIGEDDETYYDRRRRKGGFLRDLFDFD
jgi:uncharacterized protein